MDTVSMLSMTLDRRGEGLDTTPSLRALYLNDPHAMLITRAYGVGSWTLPTHATVFTGLYPSQHGLFRSLGKPRFAPGHKTLYEFLKPRGIRTAHIASHIRLDRDHGYGAGIDYYAEHTKERLGRRGRAALEDALRWLERTPDGDLFLFIHLFDAHAPYTNYPDDYSGYYSGPAPDGHEYYQDERYLPYLDSDRFPKTRTALMKRDGAYFKPNMPGSKLAYELGIRDVDDMLGDFLNALKNLGEYDRATIMFFADHGEEFYEHGFLTHSSLYAQNTLVPMLIKFSSDSQWASKLGTTRIRRQPLEAHTTLNRIIFDLFSMAPPEQVTDAETNALSLPELLAGTSKPVLAEGFYPDTAPTMYEAMWIEDGWKAHFFTRTRSDRSWVKRGQAFQLFAIESDPFDLRDSWAKERKRGVKMLRRLRAKATQLLDQSPPEPEVTPLRPDEIEGLKALGYIQ